MDVTLENLENVITSDAIILDKCKSWFNLNSRIILENMGEYPFTDFAVTDLLRKATDPPAASCASAEGSEEELV